MVLAFTFLNFLKSALDMEIRENSCCAKCFQASPMTMVGHSLMPGYDSHRFMADAEGRGTELVIFDSDQILPCYVINYK